VEVGTPTEADLILVTGILERDTFRDLRSNDIWQQFPEKAFGYSEVDNVPSFLHGVYASASRFKGMFNRMQSGSYPGIRGWRQNACSVPVPFYKNAKEFLFSFIGRKSHPVRKKLFRISWPGKDVLVADLTNEYNHWNDDVLNRLTFQTQYWETLAKSKFSLCPRGQGASSIRLFETMEVGVAPVVISDSWIPPIGINWKEFTIFIPEKKIHKLYDILKNHESEWMERGKLAEIAHKTRFADEISWDQLMMAIEKIRSSQTIPEKWFVRAKYVIYGIERIHELRYKIPILLKSMLIQDKKKK